MQMMRNFERAPQIALDPRCVHAAQISEERNAPRLVVRDPEIDLIAERVEHRLRKLYERIDGGAARPPALFLQRLRQIPMVEGHHRLDALFDELVDQTAV